jgi:ribonuclease D
VAGRDGISASFPFFDSVVSLYSRRVIDQDDKLAALLPVLRAAPWLAVDTEADSLHAYPEKLCLIQVSLPERDDLIDPLSGANLRPLWEVFSDHELIMHGADYDLRLFRKCGEFVPTRIFDTMLASRLLGCRQFGLTDLLAKFLNVVLEKGPQKANWARRPLTPRMEAYALNDTRHLKPLADILRAELVAKGRLAWHQESCARLISEASNVMAPDPDLVWRVKGSHLLGPPALAVLREIWHWRESEAVAANKPPYFILPPATMVHLAGVAFAGRREDRGSVCRDIFRPAAGTGCCTRSKRAGPPGTCPRSSNTATAVIRRRKSAGCTTWKRFATGARSS